MHKLPAVAYDILLSPLAAIKMKILVAIIFSVIISGMNAQENSEYSTVMIGEIVPHTIDRIRLTESEEFETYQGELFLSIIENDSLDTSRIQNQEVLDPENEQRILTLLLEKKPPHEMVWTDCYIPRHGISFAQNDEIVGFIEICFECFKIKTYGICRDWGIELREDDYALLAKYFTEIRK